MNTIGIIPARMGSSRFPGKPLAGINGIPMIGHVYFRSKMSQALDDVYIATCDEEIADYARQIEAPCIMTRPDHPGATDRTAEAMQKIEKQAKKRIDIAVMIQGDEPMLHPEMLDEAVRPMKRDPSIVVINLMSPLKTKEEHGDPNEVKVVVDKKSDALYFSREPIPSWKKGAKEVPMLKQVCIIPFRRDFLLKFNKLKRTPLEIIESIDMLRAMENGYKVRMVFTEFESYSVDTQQDLLDVAHLLESDPLVAEYKRVKQNPARMKVIA
jgi:3-deoxy-manno-octulosonate cytidylyltransferase (CMP-KDO synthetase)